MALLLSCVAAGPLRAAGRRRADDNETKLRRWSLRVEEGVFTASDAKAAEKIRRGGYANTAPRAAAVLGAYERLLKGNPAESIGIAGAYLVKKKALSAWREAQKEGRRAALKRWRDEVREARREKREAKTEPLPQMYAPFPPVEKWTIDENTVWCAVEVARAHMHLRDFRTALTQLAAIGRGYRDLPRVLAAECSGDLLTIQLDYPRAIDFYKYALKALSSMRVVDETSEGTKRRKLTEEEAFVKRRIEAALKRAQRLWDIARYGEGYVLYREAETLRRKEQKYRRAILSFWEIDEKYRQTVYGEASQAGQVKTYLALSRVDDRETVREWLREAREELKWREKEYKLARLCKLPAERVELLAAEVASLERRIEGIGRIPSGQEALEKAASVAKDFLAANEFGLYRGEVLVELADYGFDVMLQPKQASADYAKAWAWLEGVEASDSDLAAFSVPDKARKVSAPPAEEHSVDRWGNPERNAIAIGDVVNRKTCGWYLDDLRERCALALGFLAFARDDREAAMEWYEKVVELDRLTGQLEAKGEWNNFRRLKWGAEHGYLYAYPDELKLYAGRRRFLVLLADFYYCTERFPEAATLARRLLEGEFGRLNGKESDYPWFLIGSAFYRMPGKGRRDAAACFGKVLERREHTLTEDRALFSMGNLARCAREGELFRQGHEYLRELAYSKNGNEFSYRARVEYGWRLLGTRHEKEGLKLLKSLPKRAGIYRALAERVLQKHAEEREDG